MNKNKRTLNDVIRDLKERDTLSKSDLATIEMVSIRIHSKYKEGTKVQDTNEFRIIEGISDIEEEVKSRIATSVVGDKSTNINEKMEKYF